MNLKIELCRAPLSSDFKSEFYYLGNYIVFVPTFEENEIFVLGVVFYVQPTFLNQNNSFQPKIFIPHGRCRLPELKFKKIFYLQILGLL